MNEKYTSTERERERERERQTEKREQGRYIKKIKREMERV